MDDKQAPKMGRPPAEIDETVLEALCQVNCTDQEIAAYFSVSTRTIERLRQKPEFAARMDKGNATGRISLRRAQWKSAIDDKNTTMMIWLGKQELGQRDRVEVAGPQGGPVQIESVRRMLDNLSDADYGELAKQTGVILPAAAEGKEEEVEPPVPEPGEAA